jgi:hypothetical protein
MSRNHFEVRMRALRCRQLQHIKKVLDVANKRAYCDAALNKRIPADEYLPSPVSSTTRFLVVNQ